MSHSQLASRAAAIVAVLLLVGSPVLGAIGAVAATPGLLGNGFAGVPDNNVRNDLPVGAKAPMTAEDLRGSVMSNGPAQTLQVIVTTPERAAGYVNSSRDLSGAGGVALVFTDEQHHAGRTVALPTAAIRDALGHVPETVHGVHEDGTRWSADVKQLPSGMLTFKIPKFSSNAVTFDGRVSIDAQPATDGSSWVTDLGTYDSVGAPNVTFTGWDNTEWDNVSGTSLGDGATLAVNPAGNTEPRGPGGEPVVTLTGVGFNRSVTESGSLSSAGTPAIDPDGNLPLQGPSSNNKPTLRIDAHGSSTTNSYFQSGTGGSILWGDSGGQDYKTEIVYGNPTNTITALKMNQEYPPSESMTVDIYINEDSSTDGTFGEGTLVKDNWNPPATDGWMTVPLDTAYTGTNGDITIEFVTVSAPTDVYGQLNAEEDSSENTQRKNTNLYGGAYDDPEIRTLDTPLGVSVDDNHGTSVSFGDMNRGQTTTKEFAFSRDATQLDVNFQGGSLDWTLEYRERSASQDPAVDIDGDGTADVSYTGNLESGQTYTEAVPELGLGDDTATVSTASGSTVDVSVNLQEVTKTKNPVLWIGNHSVSYAGTLADGATVNRTGKSSWLQEGENQINLSVGDGSLSSDAPAASVGVSYTHRAEVRISTSYVSKGWLEQYNESHTYAGGRSDATVTFPFSRTVYEVTYVEYSVNGGSWTKVTNSDWTLENGTTLEVSPPDVDGDVSYEGGDTLAVRTGGEKVKVVNGEITVTEPTDPSDSKLDTQIKVVNRTNGFHIDVGGTENGDCVHYTAKETWDGAVEMAVIGADGSQELYLPNAVAGGYARVSTIPLSATPKSGDVGIHVLEPSTPKFKVMPGKTGAGSEVTYTWFASSLSDGETYGLYSVDLERNVDKGTVRSGSVSLVDDDTEEAFKIKQPSDGGGSGSSGDGSRVQTGGSWNQNAPEGTFQEIAVLVAWSAGVILLIGATGRSELKGRKRWAVVAGLGLGSGLGALEILRPGSVSGAVNVGLQEVVPLAGLAAVGIAVYSAVSWWRSRQAEASTPETQVTLDVGGGGD